MHPRPAFEGIVLPELVTLRAPDTVATEALLRGILNRCKLAFHAIGALESDTNEQLHELQADLYRSLRVNESVPFSAAMITIGEYQSRLEQLEGQTGTVWGENDQED